MILQKIKEVIGFNPEDYEESLRAVRKYPFNIEYIHVNNDKIKEEAINRDAWVMWFIRNPSLELQKIAIEKSNFSIEVIARCPNLKDLTEWIKEEGGVENIEERIIKYIEFNPENEEESLEAIKKDSWNIKYISNPSIKIKEKVIKYNYYMSYIKEPSIEDQKLAIEKSDFNIMAIARCPNWRELEGWIEDNLVIKELIT